MIQIQSISTGHAQNALLMTFVLIVGTNTGLFDGPKLTANHIGYVVSMGIIWMIGFTEMPITLLQHRKVE